ncbi:hypothetical protein CsSME_00007747 [Camellia sinensis var. sinensis]
MDSSMEEMIKLLGLGMDDAHVVGIWGMGGIVNFHLQLDIFANLVLLSLSNCKKLRSISDNICQLKTLSSLNVSGCSKLDKLPQYMGALDCLKELHLDQIAIRQLPSSIGLLKKLKTLSLEGCKGVASYSWSYSFFAFNFTKTERKLHNFGTRSFVRVGVFGTTTSQ